MLAGTRRSVALFASLTAALTLSACDSNQPVPGSEIQFPPPDFVPPADNVNITTPTLTIADNNEVSPGDTLTLVWSDEFDADALDPEVWFFATGDGTEAGLPPGWGNNELQYYQPNNAQLVGGSLVITARQETVAGRNYTSARINTEDRFAFRYGRIEARIKLPAGQGLWPAFWLLSQDSPYGSWAATGEIDIVEAVNLGGLPGPGGGGGGNNIVGQLYYGGEFPAQVQNGLQYVPSVNVSEDFHVYALEWDATEIRWYFDDTLIQMQNSWFSSAAPYPAPFDQPFHILLNLAVGGAFPGAPTDNSIFPAVMEVDWVRVYSGEP